MTARDRQKILIRCAVGLCFAVILGMLVNLWVMHDRLQHMSEQMQQWQHLIDFLEIWIKQNNLTIAPTEST